MKTRPLGSDDQEDLEAARKAPEDCEEKRPWYKCIGPGLITGAADDDPSGVGTYSANGAQFGYTLLWLVPFCIPLMIAVQEMCGRLGGVTGKGFAAVVKEHFPGWVLYPSIFLLIIANVMNIYADVNVMAASAKMLTGLPMAASIIGFAVLMALTQVLIPYRIYARTLKWLALALLGYVVVVFWPGMKNDWGAIARGVALPHLKFDSETVLAVVAFLGTTISPYLFFWQVGETVEENIAEDKADAPGQRKVPVTGEELRRIRTDTVFGMVVSQAVAFFILVAAAGTLHATGKTNIDTAQDAAKALQPLGPVAVWIFSLCIIGTGLLAIPTLAGSAAYAIAECTGWRYGLYRRFSRAKNFYLTLVACIVIGSLLNFVGNISPVKALVYSAALNGIVAPPLIIILLVACNRNAIVGRRTNGRWSNFFGWVTVILMSAAAIFYLVVLAQGKAS